MTTHLLLAAQQVVVHVVSSPFPVSIPKQVSVATDWPMYRVTLSLALGTGAMALFTVAMAIATFRLGTNAVDANNQAERHHQQSLWPLTRPFILSTDDEAHITNRQCYFIVKNVGVGPCTDCVIKLVTVGGSDNKGLHRVSLGPIGPHDYSGRAVLHYDEQTSVPDRVTFLITFYNLFGTYGEALWEMSVTPATPKQGEIISFTKQGDTIFPGFVLSTKS